jgi:hypothetical protein
MSDETFDGTAEWRKRRYEKGIIDTTDGNPPEDFAGPAPKPTGTGGQHGSYWVLSASERAKGFVRPVRSAYRHETCGSVTTMGRALAETYAAKPDFYGSTFCCACNAHFPVGADGEFTWDGTTEKVGT